MHGTIDQLHEFGGFRLALRAQAPELAELAALFGAIVPSLGPFRAAAQLTGTAVAPVFSGIDVEVGTPERMGLTARGELTGRVTAGGGFEWQSSGIDLVIQGAQFSDLDGWVGRPLPALGRSASPSMWRARWRRPDCPRSIWRSVAVRRPRSSCEAPSPTCVQRAVSTCSCRHRRPIGGAARRRERDAPAAVSRQRTPTRCTTGVSRGRSRVENRQQYRQRLAAGDRNGPRLRVTGKAASPLINLARLAAASSNANAPAACRSAASGRLLAARRRGPRSEYRAARLPRRPRAAVGQGAACARQRQAEGECAAGHSRRRELKLDGIVADPQKLSGLDLGISLQGGELADLLKFFGKSFPPLGPYQGRAQLHGSLDALGLTAIEGTAGRPGQQLRVTGQVELG